MTISSNSLSETLFAVGGEMGALMRSHDWANTPLGPVESWSQSLRTLVSTMLASRFPMSLFWEDDHIQFYNDACTSIFGAKHPTALGQPASQTWLEMWNEIKPLFDQVFDQVIDTNKAVFAEDQPFHHSRFGYLEETYFTFCYSPVWNETGKISGILCTVTETTQQVISSSESKSYSAMDCGCSS